MPTVLIVEDDPFVALHLRAMVVETDGVEVVLAASVLAARQSLRDRIALALLDIRVRDGTTYELARQLLSDGVRFVFVSGAPQAEVPRDLQVVPFLAKPCSTRKISQIVENALRSLTPRFA